MSLKAKAENAVLTVLRSDPRLRALFPRSSISVAERTDFPSMYVQAQRPAKIAPEVEIYRVPVTAVLETQFDYPFNDKLFTRIENLTGEHALIDPINSLPALGIHCFNSIGGNDSEIINPNYRTQTCAFTLVCCEI